MHGTVISRFPAPVRGRVRAPEGDDETSNLVFGAVKNSRASRKVIVEDILCSFIIILGVQISSCGFFSKFGALL